MLGAGWLLLYVLLLLWVVLVIDAVLVCGAGVVGGLRRCGFEVLEVGVGQAVLRVESSIF